MSQFNVRLIAVRGEAMARTDVLLERMVEIHGDLSRMIAAREALEAARTENVTGHDRYFIEIEI